jgi:hypothetical protein
MAWPNVALGLAALAVTLVRSAWLGLAAGLLLLLVRAPRRLRVSVLVMGLAITSVAPLAMTNARVEKVISHRIESLMSISQDKSYSDRMRSYASSMREMAKEPWGQGLELRTSPRIIQTTRASSMADPWKSCCRWASCLARSTSAQSACCWLRHYVAGPGDQSRPICRSRSHRGAQALAFSSVTTVVGEIGVLFWLAIGLVLASPRQSKLERRRAQH